MKKLIYSGIVVITLGAIGIIYSVGMEMLTGEPVWMLFMKIAAGCFGVGGGILGLAAISRRR